MKNLAQDKEELTSDKERRWASRMRREMGIAPNEAACWFVEIEQGYTDGSYDMSEVWLGMSPADALTTAGMYASNAARQDGIGSWTLEVFGDGINLPRKLRVRPHLDEQETET